MQKRPEYAKHQIFNKQVIFIKFVLLSLLSVSEVSILYVCFILPDVRLFKL